MNEQVTRFFNDFHNSFNHSDHRGLLNWMNEGHTLYGVQVHRRNIQNALLNGLKKTYPSLLVVLGESVFSLWAQAFYQENPPCTPILAQSGAGLPDWIDRQENEASKFLLSDLARLDWAALEAAQDIYNRPLGIDEVDNVINAIADWYPYLISSARLVSLKTDCLDFWYELNHSPLRPDVSLGVKMVDHMALIWRAEKVIAHIDLSREEGLVLKALKSKISLTEIIDLTKRQGFNVNFLNMLYEFIDLGIISSDVKTKNGDLA